mmetsp:Transcript_30751/g.84467  ORF Transcript_30751/g.84467 Transcript_30751/m.84467 type:complete len:441 (+) Transcript_30751:819-2141(+)
MNSTPVGDSSEPSLRWRLCGVVDTMQFGDFNGQILGVVPSGGPAEPTKVCGGELFAPTLRKPTKPGFAAPFPMKARHAHCAWGPKTCTSQNGVDVAALMPLLLPASAAPPPETPTINVVRPGAAPMLPSMASPYPREAEAWPQQLTVDELSLMAPLGVACWNDIGGFDKGVLGMTSGSSGGDTWAPPIGTKSKMSWKPGAKLSRVATSAAPVGPTSKRANHRISMRMATFPMPLLPRAPCAKKLRSKDRSRGGGPPARSQFKRADTDEGELPSAVRHVFLFLLLQASPPVSAEWLRLPTQAGRSTGTRCTRRAKSGMRAQSLPSETCLASLAEVATNVGIGQTNARSARARKSVCEAEDPGSESAAPNTLSSRSSGTTAPPQLIVLLPSTRLPRAERTADQAQATADGWSKTESPPMKAARARSPRGSSIAPREASHGRD